MQEQGIGVGGFCDISGGCDSMRAESLLNLINGLRIASGDNDSSALFDNPSSCKAEPARTKGGDDNLVGKTGRDIPQVDRQKLAIAMHFNPMRWEPCTSHLL